MKGVKTREYIDKLIAEKGIPYIDFYMSVGQKCVYRYYASKDGKVTGKEKLWLFSATKPMTVVAAMRLVEEGRLSLDDEVAKYIPAFGNTVLRDGTPTKNKMTVRQLFTMSAGLSYNAGGEPYRSLIKEAGENATTLEIIGSLAKAPLLFEPGERFEYSLCHDVLAAVMEVVSKKKFSQYVKEEIFTPLQMHNSSFDNHEQNVEDVYFAYADKSVVKINEGKILLPTPNYESGGGGLVSTAEDYIRFADALACGGIAKNGYSVLSQKGVRDLASEQMRNISVNNTFTCVQGEDYGYGLGVRVRQKPTAWGLPIGEFGWDGAAGSYVMIDPQRQVSVFIGMHVRNWPEVFTEKHLQIVESIYQAFFTQTENE